MRIKMRELKTERNTCNADDKEGDLIEESEICVGGFTLGLPEE